MLALVPFISMQCTLAKGSFAQQFKCITESLL